MRKKSKLAGFVIFILILAVGGLGYMTYDLYNKNVTRQEEITALETERDRNSKTAWITLTDIKQGEELIPDYNVELQQIYIGVDSSAFWRPDGETNIVTTDIAAGTPVFDTLVSTMDYENSSRDYEISVADLMTTQSDYDYVDIRIGYPDGSDYVVLAKKQIRDLNLSNCVFTSTLNESEIQRITSAILDAYLITGAHIYTTRYVEASLQEEAKANYPVKEATLAMLSKTNNVNIEETLSVATMELNKQARRNLEERIGAITPEDAAAAATAWEEQRAKFQALVNEMLEEQQY